MEQIAPHDPDEALALLWRFMALARSVLERCDNSSGIVIDIFHQACADLGDVANATPQPPPEFSPVAAAGRPLGIEPIKPGLEHARARSEWLGTAAPNDVPHHLARTAGATNDRLYGDAVLVQRQHRRISLGAAAPSSC